MTLQDPHLRDRLKEFLKEDLGSGDITTEHLISPTTRARAIIVCNESGIVSGVHETSVLFRDMGCDVRVLTKDGSAVKNSSKVVSIQGPARAILVCERVALNLLGRMSGIATETSRLVKLARRANSEIRVAATRKTAPGLSVFDKKAVSQGGGDTHRMRLDDCVLIKDNHLKLVGSVQKAVSLARANVSFTKKIEVEVQSEQGVEEAARAGADIILLDNMTPQRIRSCVKRLEKDGLRTRIVLEASGGITAERIQDYAKTGVDVISVGAITKSARSLDFSLKISSVS